MLLAAALAFGTRAAAGFPERPIRIVVPAPPGGSTDILARLIGAKLSEVHGVAVIVDNRSGANTIIGTSAVVQAPPDGYTLLLHSNSIVQLQSLYKKLPYDVLRDLVPLSQVALSRNVLVVQANAMARSVADLVAQAQRDPAFNYGSYGTGTASNLYGELLNRQAGMRLIQIPYRGAGPLLTGLLGGQVASAFVDIGSVRPYLEAGKLRALAVTGPARLEDLASVPTFGDLGYRGFEPSGWFGIFAPARTPAAARAWLMSGIARVMAAPEVQARIVGMGLVPSLPQAADFDVTVRADAQLWSRIISDLGIQLDV